MSRTYRRKNTDWKKNFQDYVFITDTEGRRYGTWVSYDTRGEEFRKISNKYHSDKKQYFSSVPGWFCNIRERKFRMRCKQEIQRWKLKEEHEIMSPEFIKDAGRFWW